jgi:hypothetical protein
MSKQTALEWYRNGLFKAAQEGLSISEREMFEQAKAMEKEQIKTAYWYGQQDTPSMTPTKYFNKTYGGDK